jgi:hypothetical protein
MFHVEQSEADSGAKLFHVEQFARVEIVILSGAKDLLSAQSGTFPSGIAKQVRFPLVGKN